MQYALLFQVDWPGYRLWAKCEINPIRNTQPPGIKNKLHYLSWVWCAVTRTTTHSLLQIQMWVPYILYRLYLLSRQFSKVLGAESIKKVIQYTIYMFCFRSVKIMQILTVTGTNSRNVTARCNHSSDAKYNGQSRTPDGGSGSSWTCVQW